MNVKNNTDGFGIEGDHDHHDYSGRENFKKIIESLEKIGSLKSNLISLEKIIQVNSVYKNATDILLHFATIPQTKSTLYVEPEIYNDQPINMLFENILKEFKLCQFSRVNSSDYITHLHAALTYYDQLILYIQSYIHENTNLIERKLAGRWLSIQTLSPGVDEEIKIRFPRHYSD